MNTKYKNLIVYLSKLKNAAIAFSGGVDSTFLLAAAKEALQNNIIACTVITPYVPEMEIKEAKNIAQSLGVEHLVMYMDIPEEIRNNPEQRCYLCKHKIFSLMLREIKKRGFIHVLDGTNIDDHDDFRPGMKALSELNVLSPLADNGFSKSDIRKVSREMGLPTWDKPAYACLLSRMPYNTPVKEEQLKKIELAEELIRNTGFRQVRVRSHDNLARIELDRKDIIPFIKKSGTIIERIKSLGYKYVTIDIEGYKTGSFN